MRRLIAGWNLDNRKVILSAFSDDLNMRFPCLIAEVSGSETSEVVAEDATSTWKASSCFPL